MANTKQFWDSLPANEQKKIADMARASCLKVDRAIIDFNKNGDRKDDIHEDTFQVPQQQASPTGRAGAGSATH